MLGHDLFLYPELTARENLTFFAHLYGLERRARCRVTAALERAGLVRSRRRSRVGLLARHAPARRARARAAARSATDPARRAVHRPRSGVDRGAGRAVARAAAAGCLIVLATHDLDVADGLLSRAIYLKDGRMVGTDTGSRRPARSLSAGDPAMSGFFRVAWHVMRKDMTVEVRSLEILFDDAVLRGHGGPDVFVRASSSKAAPLDDVAAGDPVGGDRVFRHARAGPHLRARASQRHAARAAAGAGRSPGASTSASCSGILLLLGARRDRAGAAGRPAVQRADLRARRCRWRCCWSRARWDSRRSARLFAAMLVRARSRDMLLPGACCIP